MRFTPTRVRRFSSLAEEHRVFGARAVASAAVRRGGILLTKGELVFEIRNAFPLFADLFRLIGVLLTEPFIVALQTIDLARMTIRRVPSLILVALASVSHATFMADSRKTYEYGILDQ